jgi:hypothetical protein
MEPFVPEFADILWENHRSSLTMFPRDRSSIVRDSVDEAVSI